MVIGGGGTSRTSNGLFFDPPQCRVITAVGATPEPTPAAPAGLCARGRALVGGAQRRPRLWLRRLRRRSGSHPGDFTSIKVTYYDVVGAGGEIAPFETFILRRPRRD